MAAEIISMSDATEDGGSPTSRKRSLLKDKAYTKIRNYLLEHDSGASYSERALAAHLGLGLGSVRSAIERLRVEGLLVVSPNSGFRLPEITSKEILDFYELRMVTECHVVASLAGCLSVSQRVRIEEILDEQESTARSGDTVRYHQLDLEFHAALTEFHGNAEMSDVLRRMREKMYRLARRMHGAHPERLEINAAQHRRIFEEVRDGNGDAARERMRMHLDWGCRFTLDPDRRLGTEWQRPEDRDTF